MLRKLFRSNRWILFLRFFCAFGAGFFQHLLYRRLKTSKGQLYLRVMLGGTPQLFSKQLAESPFRLFNYRRREGEILLVVRVCGDGIRVQVSGGARQLSDYICTDAYSVEDLVFSVPDGGAVALSGYEYQHFGRSQGYSGYHLRARVDGQAEGVIERQPVYGEKARKGIGS